MRYCLVIPHYNHERQFLEFLPQLVSAGVPLVVVDDGSSVQSLDAVRQAVGALRDVHVYCLNKNRGKGAAVIAGFHYARGLGYTHVVQIDADGQHCVDDLTRFISASEAQPQAIVCGKPVFDDSAPKARLYGRKVTDFWVALETLSLKIKDGLCGYRVYPLDQVEWLLDHTYIGPRMAFDTEILVKAVWHKIPLVFLPTQVTYPAQSVSHFHYVRDNWALIRLHSRLMLGMFLRAPMLVWHRVRGL